MSLFSLNFASEESLKRFSFVSDLLQNIYLSTRYEKEIFIYNDSLNKLRLDPKTIKF